MPCLRMPTELGIGSTNSFCGAEHGSGFAFGEILHPFLYSPNMLTKNEEKRAGFNPASFSVTEKSRGEAGELGQFCECSFEGMWLQKQ